MRFTKMQGLGNDYLYVFGEVPKNICEISKTLSDRHFGAGSDGMIYISPAQTADFSMRIFNADGSEAKMCGNGIRCVGKYVYEKGYTDKSELKILTLSGIKTLHLDISEEKVNSVSVDMGKAKVLAKKYITPLGINVLVNEVDIGNPHAVIFCKDAQVAPLDTLGKAIETHPEFEGGINVEFISVLDENKLRMRVWERGSGITLACGTGACASVAAAVENGVCDIGREVEVVLDGGSLYVTVDENFNVKMRGPAEFVFEGESKSF